MAINIAMIKGGGWYNFKRLQRVVFVIQWLERQIRYAVMEKVDSR